MGRRFGGAKAFALLPDGRNFLTSCFQGLDAAGGHPVLATLPRGIEGTIPTGLLHRRVDPDLDMFGSLRLGLKTLLEFDLWETVIILPVDHPLIDRTTFQRLSSTSAPAAIATYKSHHGHPVALARNIASGIVDRSLPGPTLREVLRATGAIDVEVDDPQTRANCNTPNTLEQAWRLKHHHSD